MAPDNREGGDITAADMVLPEEEPSEIQEFYKDSTVFITGATGYLGKLILEKLLRCCPDLKHIYILLREKKGKDREKRFQEIFDVPIFEPLKRSKVNFKRKITMLSGDCAMPDLGLNERDKNILLTQVDVIIHCAATVRFDEHLKLAAMINVRAVRDLIAMAKQMKQLKAFVHVSTAYSHCPRKEIDEKFYPARVAADKLLALIDTLDDDMLKQITPTLLGSWPNTYVFTKAIAEEVIETKGNGLPIAVVRPSIVIATAKEPIAGWIDNFYGSTGILIGAALGVIRTLHGDERNRADVVPADHVINNVIAAAWNIHSERIGENREVDTKKNEEKPIPVYNYVSGPQNPLTWREYTGYATKHAMQIPSPHIIWYSWFKVRPNRTWNLICVYLLHFLPALIVDSGAKLLGRKPVMMEGYRKINKFGEVISYFAMREWNFKNDSVQRLWRKMNPADREMFQFDMAALDWDAYNYTYLRGVRLYLLKDPLDTIPEGRVKYRIVQIAHYTLVTFLLLALLFIVRFIVRLFL